MSDGLSLGVSPDEMTKAADRLTRTGRTRIPFLLGDATTEVYRALETPCLPWMRAFDSPMQADIPAAIFDASTPEAQNEVLGRIHEKAVDQFQYLFDRLPLMTAPGEAKSLPPILYQVLDLFNSEAFMTLARRLTGNDRVNFADGQATRYLPGHFLNRHSDDNPKTERLYAYVLNLSPCWRAEWGGLLQFLDTEGEITETFVPSFGTLNVFAVPQLHAVSPVSAFTGGPRYSVTGWWRALPVPI